MNSEPTHLSVIVITFNEEQNIAACLKSVEWADGIIVVDSRSSDRTVEIAREFTNKVYTIEWKGYAGAKTYALEQASRDWVLWLDADERISPRLALEIRNVILSATTFYSVYEFARKAFVLGKWIRHCGWYPGYVMRLFRRGDATFDSSNVHEKLRHEGPVGRLTGDLLHNTDENLYHYFEKANRYTSLAVKDVAAAGRMFSLYDVLVRPPYLFIKMYVIRFGFLDGMHGLVLSLLSAAYVFTKYAKLWELQSALQRKGI